MVSLASHNGTMLCYNLRTSLMPFFVFCRLLKGASEFLAEAFHEGKYVISYWFWILVTGKLFGMWVGKIFGDVGC